MKHTKLDPKLKLNHHVTAMEFIAKTVCTSCVIVEGMCRNFLNSDYDACYKECWTYARAVKDVAKVLDRFDK